MIKRYSALAILIGFFGIAAFGFTFMNHNMMHGTGCVASAMAGADCPINQIAYVMYHFTAFQNFFSIIAPLAFSILLTVAFLSVLSVLFFLRRDLHRQSDFSLRSLRKWADSRIFSVFKFIHWLAKLEHSPSL